MKKYIPFLIIFLFSFNTLTAQPNKDVDAKITEVTVFVDGGQIFRQAEVQLSAGKNILTFVGLSPFIDASSLNVKAYGDFTTLSVSHQNSESQKIPVEEEILAIQDKIDQLNEKIADENTWLKVLEERESFLTANKLIGGKNTGIDMTSLKSLNDYYSQQMESIRFEMLKRKRLIKGYSEEIKDFKDQMSDFNEATKELPSGQIVVAVDAKTSVKAKFKLSYLVSQVGWYPKYDVRVSSISEPLQLVYKATIHQNTGVDWEKVKIKLSNATPNSSGTAPHLSPEFLDIYRYETGYTKSNRYANYKVNPNVRSVSGKILDADTKEPIPFASIVVAGTTVGTTSDFDGNFNLAIPTNSQVLVVRFVGYGTAEVPIYSNYMSIDLEASAELLESVVVVSGVRSSRKNKKYEPASIPEASIVRKETSVEFDIPIKYSLQSKGKPITVGVQTFPVNVDYEYHIVPKLDETAYLTANFTDWEEFNLLSGETNIYFENTFIGKSVFDIENLTDTINLSLGKDMNVVVKREKVKEFSKTQWVGNNKVVSRNWLISVRNTKSNAINVVVFDQVPVSLSNDINVQVEELSAGKLDEDSGQVTWKFNLSPAATKELILKYSVKHPKAESVAID